MKYRERIIADFKLLSREQFVKKYLSEKETRMIIAAFGAYIDWAPSILSFSSTVSNIDLDSDKKLKKQTKTQFQYMHTYTRVDDEGTKAFYIYYIPFWYVVIMDYVNTCKQPVYFILMDE